MSTERMEKANAVDSQPLAEWIEEEGLDLVVDEVITSERLAHIVMVMRNRLQFYNSKVVDWETKIGGKVYQIRLNNNYKGFVSVTNEDGDTGVSYTEYYPYFVDDDDPNDFPALLSLAQMINEAWYNANN